MKGKVTKTPVPTTKVGETRRLPSVPASAQSGGGDGDRIVSGLPTSEWNAAIRLSCAVRDAIDRPVSMIMAFDMARDLIRERGGFNEDDVKRLQGWFDEQVETERREKEEQRKRIASTAGQR